MNDDWLECRSNESNRSDYDYKYEEDPDNMVVKKYKKPKPQGGNLGSQGISNMNSVIKDPIIYNEEVTFNFINEADSALIPHLLDMQFVVPFGFPTETYLAKLKNHVQECIETDK